MKTSDLTGSKFPWSKRRKGVPKIWDDGGITGRTAGQHLETQKIIIVLSITEPSKKQSYD